MTDTFNAPTPLDPNRRRAPKPHPGIAPFPEGASVGICHLCGCVIPAIPEWVEQHITYVHGRPR